MSKVNTDAIKTLKSQNLQKINKGKKRTHTFAVDFSEYNEEFVGNFTVHHPTQIERMQIGIVKSTLLNGVVPMDTITDNIAHIISTLEVVLDEKPDWFDVNDPDVEYDILWAVFEEYLNWVSSFRKGLGNSNNTGDSGESTSEV